VNGCEAARSGEWAQHFSNASCLSCYSGTHGYMAPEVLSKGTAYDSSADWFSFGCMIYKLLKGYVTFVIHPAMDADIIAFNVFQNGGRPPSWIF